MTVRARNKCGGSKTVKFFAAGNCSGADSCFATFTVPAPAGVILNCAVNVTEAACQTQAQIDTKFATWLATATKSGGCNAVLSNNNTGAPAACGALKQLPLPLPVRANPTRPVRQLLL
ncbi:MAG: hypothetical protein IPG87_17205 [Saprospiraceae bacterium]|nr:hypothetical protein [Candidatus Vicinibacter affinis]